MKPEADDVLCRNCRRMECYGETGLCKGCYDHNRIHGKPRPWRKLNRTLKPCDCPESNEPVVMVRFEMLPTMGRSATMTVTMALCWSCFDEWQRIEEPAAYEWQRIRKQEQERQAA